MRFIVVFLALFPSLALAQQGTFVSKVTSGEHDTFTRLVVELPASASWEISTRNEEVVFTIIGRDVTYDTVGVFDKIPKDRIRAVQATGTLGELQILLSCECEVESFDFGTNYAVVDIKTAPPEALYNATGSSDLPVAYRYWLEHAPSPLMSLTFSEGDSAESTLSDETGRAGAPHQANANETNQQENLSDKKSIEKLLMAEISQAEDLGLVETASTETASAPINSSLIPNILIKSSALEAAEGQINLGAGDVEDAKCLKPEDTQIWHWSDALSLSEALGDLRGQMYAEFDRPDVDAVKKLARTYIYFGLGAEARQTIGLLADEVVEIELINAFASIFEENRSKGAGIFATQMDCEGAGPLWASIASGRVPGNADPEQIEREFRQLPMHLKGLLGARLSQVFAESGSEQRASSVLRNLSRAELGSTEEVSLAKATIARTDGDFGSEVLHLEDAVAESKTQSVEAVLQLVEIHHSRLLSLDAAMPELISSYVTEFGGSHFGPALRHAEVIAYALNSQFDRSFSLLDKLVRENGEVRHAELQSEVWSLFGKKSSDVELLRFVLKRTGSGPLGLENEPAFTVAQRLHAIGFSDLAYALLKNAKDADNGDRKTKILKAETAIATNLPHRALVELSDVVGEDADRLRVTAYSMNNDTQSAAEISERLSLEDADRLHWFTGDKAGTAREAGTFYGDLNSQRMAMVETPEKEGLSPIEFAKRLLESSNATRMAASQTLKILAER